MQMKTALRLVSVSVVSMTLAAQLSACGGGGGDSVAPVPQGTARVALASESSATCNYSAVNVNIATVKAIPYTPPANVSDGNWNILTQLNSSTKVNLLEFTNGSSKDLGMKSLPAGHYSEVFLRLENNPIWGTPASVIPLGSLTETAINAGTLASTGVTIPYEFDVPNNGQVDLLLTFSGCDKIIDASSGTLKLVPQITVTSTTGS